MKSWLVTVTNWLLKHELIVILLLLMVLLRVPNMFEPYWYGDEGIYLTLGQAMRQGARLYADIVDNKTPMIYWLSQAAGSLVGLKILLMMAAAASMLLFYQLSTIFLKKRSAVRLANVLFMLAITLPTFEGNIANGELFFLPFVLAGMLLWWKYKKAFSAGCLLGLAVLTKVPAFFEGMALFLWLLLFVSPDGKALKRLASGGVLIILLSLIYFALQGALTPYLHFGFLYNFKYIQAWEAPVHTLFLGFLTSMIGRFGLLVLSFVWLFLNQKRFTKHEHFLLIWSLLSLFAALLSLRPYPHYFLQIMPSACLLAGSLLYTPWPKRIYMSLPLLIAWIAFKALAFAPYPTLTYYQNFAAYLTGQSTQAQFYQAFDQGVPDTYALAKWLVLRTSSEERVFIWGDEPLIYALSHRLPIGRFAAAYHIEALDAFEETMVTLKAKPPKYIIDTRQEPNQFPALYQLLKHDYAPYEEVGRARIYRKLVN